MVSSARHRKASKSSAKGRSGTRARGVVLLGATGSIGTQCLDVLRRFPDQFQVVGLSVHRHWQQGLALARKTRAKVLCISDEAAYARAMRHKPAGLKILRGAGGLVELAALADRVTQAFVDVTKVQKEQVWIVFHDVKRADWAMGGRLLESGG